MRKLLLGMFVSLDGFVSGPNGKSTGSSGAGTTLPTKWIVENLWQAGVLSMGSRTYYEMAAFWPSSNAPFAAPMNEIPKIVFTRKGLTDAPGAKAATAAPVKGSWDAPIVASGELSGEVARLKAQPGKDIRALGGAGLAQEFAAHGFIDEYHLLVAPVAPGKGVPLFSGLSKPLDLQLVSTRTFDGGAIALVYRTA